MNKLIAALKTALLLSFVASLVVVGAVIGEWLEKKSHADEASANTLAASGTSIPTPFQPLKPTFMPNTASPTPILNPYEYEGLRFDQEKEITITLELPESKTIALGFLPVRHREKMAEDFGQYCPVGLRKGCVYASDGHISILVHSGCAPKPLVAEELRVRLEGGGVCGFPKDTPADYKEMEGLQAVVVQENVSINLSILLMEYIPAERIEEFGKSMRPVDLAEQIGENDFSSGMRHLYLITSGRRQDSKFGPSFSASRWLIILG